MWETLDEQAAEAVRSHLVMLRGGAPFLGPDDASLLHSWLSEGWSSTQIIHALERAADARRRRPRRVPLALKHARSHLGKVSKGALGTRAVRVSAHPLSGLTDRIRRLAPDDPRTDALVQLADRLDTLPADDVSLLEARANTLCRDFLLQAWSAMDAWEREARLTDARASLAGLHGVLSAEALEASSQEIARDQLRQGYSVLSAATIRQALRLSPEASA